MSTSLFNSVDKVSIVDNKDRQLHCPEPAFPQKNGPIQTAGLFQLPPELLLDIIDHLPYNNIYALMLTHPDLHAFIKTNVKHLKDIRIRFITELESSIYNSDQARPYQGMKRPGKRFRVCLSCNKLVSSWWFTGGLGFCILCGGREGWLTSCKLVTMDLYVRWCPEKVCQRWTVDLRAQQAPSGYTSVGGPRTKCVRLPQRREGMELLHDPVCPSKQDPRCVDCGEQYRLTGCPRGNIWCTHHRCDCQGHGHCEKAGCAIIDKVQLCRPRRDLSHLPPDICFCHTHCVFVGCPLLFGGSKGLGHLHCPKEGCDGVLHTKGGDFRREQRRGVYTTTETHRCPVCKHEWPGETWLDEREVVQLRKRQGCSSAVTYAKTACQMIWAITIRAQREQEERAMLGQEWEWEPRTLMGTW